MEILTEKEMNIVGHTIGINVYHATNSKNKKDKKLPEEFYRNYFCAGTEGHHEFEILVELEKRKIMQRWKQYEQIYFCVTDYGIELFKKQFKDQVK